MSVTSAQFSLTLRVELPHESGTLGKVTQAISRAGGAIVALDTVEAGGSGTLREVTIDCESQDHRGLVIKAVQSVREARLVETTDRTFELHRRGKIHTGLATPIKTRDDLSMAYTPGVARVCSAIAENRQKAFKYTIKANTVAVVTDGSAVLGLGDIGPEAAMPVMEGKAMLFKEFADVDAFPIALDTKDPDKIVEAVALMAPTFGGINLEDISAPRCFEIEARLRDILDVPVFHDDQHGTAIVVLAALTNALRVVGKDLDSVRLVLSGAGAAGTAILRLLLEAGVRDVIVADVGGVIHRGRPGLHESLVWLAEATNAAELTGDLKGALVGADVFVGVSAADLLTGEDVSRMAEDAIVFALANPVPEIDPGQARAHAAVVATGRSDYPNQINNVLAFPGVFRGLLDASATQIDDTLLVAAAEAIAAVVTTEELNVNYIIPSVFHADVHTAVAAAVRQAAERIKAASP